MPAFSLPAGVPPLPSGYIDFFSPPPIILEDDPSVSFLAAQTPQWGIFLNGEAQIVADNTVSFSYKQDWVLSDYPVEQGSFEMYDKVWTPFEVRLRFSAGGSDADRKALLDSVDSIANAYTLFDAYTPEVTYPSINITHYDYRRTSDQGVGLLVIDVWCLQVRESGQQQFTQTQAPSGSDPRGGGSVQAVPPTTAQQQMLSQVT